MEGIEKVFNVEFVAKKLIYSSKKTNGLWKENRVNTMTLFLVNHQ